MMQDFCKILQGKNRFEFSVFRVLVIYCILRNADQFRLESDLPQALQKKVTLSGTDHCSFNTVFTGKPRQRRTPQQHIAFNLQALTQKLTKTTAGRLTVPNVWLTLLLPGMLQTNAFYNSFRLFCHFLMIHSWPRCTGTRKGKCYRKPHFTYRFLSPRAACGQCQSVSLWAVVMKKQQTNHTSSFK